MKHLFAPVDAAAVKQRLAQVQPDAPRQWGTMTAAQALAHCSLGLEMALGDHTPPRLLLGRIIGRLVKRLALGDDAPLRRDTPTAATLMVTDQRELERERVRLAALIDRFAAAGPAGCTTAPHLFFGRLTPEEWATLMHKHLDHHLRQFGA